MGDVVTSYAINLWYAKQVQYQKFVQKFIANIIRTDKHIVYGLACLSLPISNLKRVRPFVPVNTLMTIFNSLVQPHFNYCCEVWDSCCNTLAVKLQKLQNRAARVLTFSGYDASADPLIEILGWQKLE